MTVAAVFIARVVAQKDLDNQKPVPWRGWRCVPGVRVGFTLSWGAGAMSLTGTLRFVNDLRWESRASGKAIGPRSVTARVSGCEEGGS